MVLLALLLVAPQQPAQTPVFRSRIDVARLDVTVIDNKTGKPVTDLTEADFTISENKTKQRITSFAREILTPQPPAPAPGAVVRRPGEVAPNNRRIFLFVLNVGRWGTDGPVKPLDGTIRFIRERLLPQDLVAVMAFNRATDFTTDHEQAAQFVERLRLRKEAIQFEMFKQFVMKKDDDEDISAATQADIDALFQTPGDATVRARSATTMLLGTDVFRAADDVSFLRPWNRMVADSDVLKMYAGIEYLRHLEGEKHLVCLTPGLSMPIEVSNAPRGLWVQDTDDEEHLAARANDARVALDLIDTSGTAPVSFNGSNLAALDEIMSGQNISNLGGGQYTSVRTADAALARIDDASRAGYVLGYTPSNSEMDGKYRHVDVRVNRSDVTVVFRHGYTASAEPAALDLRELVTSLKFREAAATDVDARDIRIRATAEALPPAAGVRMVRIELTIDAARLTLTEAGDRREGSIDLLILVGDQKQKVIGSLRQRLTLSLDAARYEQAKKNGIPYTTLLQVTGSAASVKALVYDYAADLVGSVVANVR